MKINKEKATLILQIVFVVGLSFILKYGIVIIVTGLIIVFYGFWQEGYVYWLGRDKVVENELEKKLASNQTDKLTKEEKDVLVSKKLTLSVQKICLKVGLSLVVIGTIISIFQQEG